MLFSEKSRLKVQASDLYHQRVCTCVCVALVFDDVPKFSVQPDKFIVARFSLVSDKAIFFVWLSRAVEKRRTNRHSLASFQ